MRRPPRSVHIEIDYEKPLRSGPEVVIGRVWHCTLTCDGRTLTASFATYGRRRPTQTEVFGSFVQDARDYASDQDAYDADLYSDIPDAALEFESLLGPALYARVLDEWEDL